MTDHTETPITGICIVSDKTRVPAGFTAIEKAYDEKDKEADVWKESFFSMSSTYRYICLCKTVPPNAFVCNVVADIMITNHGDVVPPSFVPLEYTEDTREKSLRKKQLCIRLVPRETAVDAVSDLIILTKQRRPPPGYTLAGEIDGLCICFKWGVIPPDFPSSAQGGSHSNTGMPNSASMQGMSQNNTPYPLHAPPQQPQEYNGHYNPNPLVNDFRANVNLQRQNSLSRTGIEGLPFQLHSRLRSGGNQTHVNRIEAYSCSATGSAVG